MTAHEFIKNLPFLPTVNESVRVNRRPSNSEIRRWLQNRSVVINGKKPDWDEEIDFPVNQLIFFPKGRTVTML